jgi:predicted acyltransferase (DUF342 family)
LTVTSGGISVEDGGATIAGNSSITGDLTVTENLTVEGSGQVLGDLTVSNALNVGNTLMVSTGGITVLEGGITVVEGGATIEGTSAITGDLIVTGHVLPGADDEYDLGSGTQRWRTGYFGTVVEVGRSVRLVAEEPDRLEYSGDGIVRTDGYLALETGGAERVRITATGDVGIGTNTPAARLHVEGTGRFADRLTVTSGGISVEDGGATIAGNSSITGDLTVTENLTVEGSGQVSGGLTVGDALNVGNGIVVDGGATIQGNSSIVGDLSTSGGTVAFSETARLTNTGDPLTLPSDVVVVEIEDGAGADDINVSLPTGTQGQLLFIRYSGTRQLTFPPSVSPNGTTGDISGPFHAILMYIGGAWRLMSLVR